MTKEQLPASAFVATSHEILALLSFNTGDGIDLSRTVLGLEALDVSSDLVRAGLSTLNVRHYLDVEGDELSLTGEAEALARILAGGHTWYDITRIGQSESSLPNYVVEAAGAKAALFLQPMSQFLCVPLRADVNLTDYFTESFDAAVEAAEAAGEGVVMARESKIGQEIKVANVKIADGSPRLLASLPLDPSGQLSVRELPTSATPGVVVLETFTQNGTH